jgi:predicted CoA-binding protein
LRSAFGADVDRDQAWQDKEHIIAAGSYLAKEPTTAEIALAVDDAFHGKGLGTLLLERLALLAIRHGFLRLWAVTHADNRAMREVFRESGFEVHEVMGNGDMEVDVSLVPTEATVKRSEIPERIATAASLRPFFQPRSVAVIGASRHPSKIGSKLLEALVTNKFNGSIYPINRYVSHVHGQRVYPSMRDVPSPVDLAIIAVPCDAVLSVVEDCANRNVSALIVITAGFAEVDANGREVQQRLVQQVREHGMRMVAPIASDS